MDARTNQVLGKLEDVAINLDTAPDAYRAHWSPDSKHVGITSRADQHWAANVIYRIENRRAYSVETPELLCHAVADFCDLTKEIGRALIGEECGDTPCNAQQNQSGSEIVKWISPTRFVVNEDSRWKIKRRDPTVTLGNYAQIEKGEDGRTGDPADVYDVRFKAEGECELVPSDKTRVVSTRPVKVQETTE